MGHLSTKHNKIRIQKRKAEKLLNEIIFPK